MTRNRTLIAYATKGGVTGENAELIGEILRREFRHQVDVVNLMKAKVPDLTAYDNVIIGSGIRMGMWYRKAKKLLKNKALVDKRVVIFLSSGMAGNPETYPMAKKKFIDKMLAKNPHIKPVACEAFGGRYPAGNKIDMTDPKKVKVWAKELGRKLR